MEPMTDQMREELRIRAIKEKALLNRKKKRRARLELQRKSRKINRKK